MAQEGVAVDPEGSTAEATSETIAETESGLEVLALESIRAVESDRWNGLVDRADCGSVFHRYEWIDAIESGLDYSGTHFVLQKDGNVIGVFPNVVVDLPRTPFRRLTSIYPGFAGPLVTTDVEDGLETMLEAVSKRCTGRTVVHEIRGRQPSYLRYNDVLQANGYRPVRTGCRFEIDLSDGYEAVRSGMSRSRRRGVDRGREGDVVVVEEDPTTESLARFHEVYEQVMDRVDGEAYSIEFFEQLLAMRSRLLLLTLRIDGEYAGGVLELLDDETDTVHGFFAAVPEEYFDDHASAVVYDAVIRWGIHNGYETYDLGDTVADFRHGVFRFKESFGGEIVPNLFWERGCGPIWPFVRLGRSLYWRYYKTRGR